MIAKVMQNVVQEKEGHMSSSVAHEMLRSSNFQQPWLFTHAFAVFRLLQQLRKVSSA